MEENEFNFWREVAKKTEEERKSFKVFAINFYKRVHKREFAWSWHYDLIVKKYLGAIKAQKNTKIEERLNKVIIFNVPPRSGKTELILKLLPIWLAGHNENLKFISTSYSASMVQSTAKQVRDYWISKDFKVTFPWRGNLDISEKSKGAWSSKNGLQYYATGSGGSITGFGADIFNIDDPSKPNEVARTGNELHNINAWFGNTVFSRLNPDGLKLIFVIMQRLDDNDLCGYLLETFKKKFDSGFREKVVIPAIATKTAYTEKKMKVFFLLGTL